MRLLTSFAIWRKPSTICFAKGRRSPQHKRPSVNSALSFIFDGTFAFATILNNLSATENLLMTSLSSISFLFTLNGLSVCKSASCFWEVTGNGRPLHRANSETAVHEALTNNVCWLTRKLAEISKQPYYTAVLTEYAFNKS